jgi:hypothetical protein
MVIYKIGSRTTAALAELAGPLGERIKCQPSKLHYRKRNMELSASRAFTTFSYIDPQTIFLEPKWTADQQREDLPTSERNGFDAMTNAHALI